MQLCFNNFSLDQYLVPVSREHLTLELNTIIRNYGFTVKKNLLTHSCLVSFITRVCRTAGIDVTSNPLRDIGRNKTCFKETQLSQTEIVLEELAVATKALSAQSAIQHEHLRSLRLDSQEQINSLIKQLNDAQLAHQSEKHLLQEQLKELTEKITQVANNESKKEEDKQKRIEKEKKKENLVL